MTTLCLDWYPVDLALIASAAQSAPFTVSVPTLDRLEVAGTGLHSRLITVPLGYTASPASHVSITVTYNGAVWVRLCACGLRVSHDAEPAPSMRAHA